MGTTIPQPSQNNEVVAATIVDASSAVAVVGSPNTQEEDAVSSSAAPYNQLAQFNITDSTVAQVPESSSAAGTSVSVVLQSTYNMQQLPVCLALHARLHDLQDMLWRRFTLTPSAYTLTAGDSPLQPHSPLCAQVQEGGRILLHPSHRNSS